MALWDAINRYAVSCGGDSSEATASKGARMDAVVGVENALSALVGERASAVCQEIAAWLAKEDERQDGLWSVNDARRRIADGSWRSK